MTALLVVASTAVAVRMTTFALADLSADSHPELALRLDGGHARALVARAESSLMNVPADAEAAERDAREALRRDPLATRALQRLARAADAKGETERAASLFRSVATSTHRDLYTELRLLTAAIDKKDFSSMTARLDHLLRGQNQTIWETILSPLTQTLTQPGYSQSLADLLGTRPPWRTWFVHWLAKQSKDVDGLQALTEAMMATPAPPSADELGALLNRLIEDGRGGAAYAVWRRARYSDPEVAPPLLQHGRFEDERRSPPFDWQFDPQSGSNIAVRPNAAAPGGRALQIDFFGGRSPFHNVSQLLALEPGFYRLSGMQSAERLQTARGLAWGVSCARTFRPIAESSTLSGDVAWKPFEFEFEVARDCPIQRLQLQLVGNSPSDFEARGAAYYADLAITRSRSTASEKPTPPGAPPLNEATVPMDVAAVAGAGGEVFTTIAKALRLRGRNTALEGPREAWTD